jgi:hypothetical protein
MILVRKAHHKKIGNDAIAVEVSAFVIQYLRNGAVRGDHVADLSICHNGQFHRQDQRGKYDFASVHALG